jgi:hypothetical protein
VEAFAAVELRFAELDQLLSQHGRAQAALELGMLLEADLGEAIEDHFAALKGFD